MQRRNDLDWVRVCAFGLLVLYHVGMYYVSWDWHVKSPAAGPAIEPLMFLTSPWRLSLLFLVSGAAFALARLALVGVFDSSHALADDWYNHVQYFAMFAIGFAIAHAAPAWERIEALRWSALVLALASWAFIAWYFRQYAQADPPQSLRMLQRLLWGLNQWAAVVAVLSFMRRWAPGDSPLLRYLGAAVFTVYILHQTLIILLSQALLPLALPPWLEAPLLALATFALSLAGFELARRIPPLRPLLGVGRPHARAPGPAA